MFKRWVGRLEAWIGSILRGELASIREDLNRLQVSHDSLLSAAKAAEEGVKIHVSQVAKGFAVEANAIADHLHTDISADAKAISLFRNTCRRSCTRCGIMTWDYVVDKTTQIVKCVSCAKVVS